MQTQLAGMAPLEDEILECEVEICNIIWHSSKRLDKPNPKTHYTTPLFNKLQSFRGLLVDESMGIGPQEQNCEQQYQNVTHQSKKVILKQLKKNPNSSGSAKCASRNFLVPPQ